MIISRYLLKEVFKTELAVFFILMTIFISNKFVRVLDEASEGGIPGHLVMVFIGLRIPELAGMILPLSLFLGILLSYGRIYADSEMTVLHACGVSEWYVVRVTFILSLCTAILAGIFTIYLSPIAAEYERQVKGEIASDTGLNTLISGRFKSTGNNKAVVFIHDKDDETNTLHKVFVAELPRLEKGHNEVINGSIVYAEQGLIKEDESGLQRLILSKGKRYQHDLENQEFREVAFDKYHIEIQEPKVSYKRRKLSAITTPELLQDSSLENQAEYAAELQWRFAFPIACLIITLVAVPLSVVNPRQGKFAKFLPALLLFLGYFLLLTAMRSAVENAKIPSYIGLWPMHLLVFFIGFILLFQQRKSGWKFKNKLPKFLRKKRNN